ERCVMLYLFEVYTSVGIAVFTLTLGVSLVLYAFRIAGLVVARGFRMAAANLNQFQRSRSMPVRPVAPRSVRARQIQWLQLPTRYLFGGYETELSPHTRKTRLTNPTT